MGLSLLLSLLVTYGLAFAPSFSTKRFGIHLASGSAASSPAEDLELTRQLVMDYIGKEEEDETEFSVPFDDRKESYSSPSRPQHDLIIRAALGKEPTEKTPVWLFRQAGRHLPEYKAYKQKVQRSFLEMLNHPEDVAECTLQPLRRYDVDAAILFSDILVIVQALNMQVTMPGGVGILVPNPLTGPEQVSSRIPPLEEITPQYVEQQLRHVMESIRQIRAKMEMEGKSSLPLIGFSAAPWTLFFYMVGGSSKKNTDIGVTWLNDHPEESSTLLKVLTKIVVEYMSLQVENGVHMLQVFEAMGMMIDKTNFYKYAMPCLKVIATELKARFPDVPLMVFARGACYANGELSKYGYDVVTIDGSVSRDTARDAVEGRAALQGNYDPRELIIDDDNGHHTPDTVRQTARQMLVELGPQRLIANLGEGLGGNESPALVEAFVNAIHQESQEMISTSS